MLFDPTDSPDQVSTPAVEEPQAPEANGWRVGFRALRHRNFRLFMAGQLVSLVGTFMQTVAQSWLVWNLSHSEWKLGAVWFCAQVPVFLLAPIGGLAADRYSRHRIVVATQTLAMLQAFAMATLTLSHRIQVWHVFVLATFLGVVNAFDMPGRQSLLIQMTGREDLLSAISLNSAMFNAARSDASSAKALTPSTWSSSWSSPRTSSTTFPWTAAKWTPSPRCPR